MGNYKLTPEAVIVADDNGRFCRATVLAVYTYAPGKAPARAPIKRELTAVELRTAHGSRWYGFKHAWIGGDLRMHVGPVNARDLVTRGWQTSDEIGKPAEDDTPCETSLT